MRKCISLILAMLIFAALLPAAVYAALPTVIAAEVISLTEGEMIVQVTFSEPVNLQTDNSRVMFFLDSVQGGSFGGVQGGEIGRAHV